jgi:hypothetical protein
MAGAQLNALMPVYPSYRLRLLHHREANADA